MDIILDTNALLKALVDPSKLKAKGKKILLNESNNIYFCDISIFEIAIKMAIGKLPNKKPPSDYVFMAYKSGFEKCDISVPVYDLYQNLELHHKDPFDRLLIALSIYHNYTIMTSDQIFSQYPVSVYLI